MFSFYIIIYRYALLVYMADIIVIIVLVGFIQCILYTVRRELILYFIIRLQVFVGFFQFYTVKLLTLLYMEGGMFL